mgnify:CR=1 FL=1
MKFVKMNGCGNDYVYFDLFDEDVRAHERDIILSLIHI